MRAIGTGQPSDAAGPTLAQLNEVLEVGDFYLRRSLDPGGRTLYRIFHQGLVDRLRVKPLGDNASEDEAPAAHD
jgi:hypothetical protein